MIFFTSDTHFNHVNIIKYCNRPFVSVEEMNEAMIANWNGLVKSGDTVYHLGDFALGQISEVPNIVRRLNGTIHLVYGNHDKVVRQKRGDNYGFASINPVLDIKVSGQRIFLMHYAMHIWDAMHRGSWQLHGHSHGKGDRDLTKKRLDVGVDCWDYTPISFERVHEEMKKHIFVPVDHHGVDDRY